MAVGLVVEPASGQSCPGDSGGGPSFEDEFTGTSLGAGWSTFDGFAAAEPDDIYNHAVFSIGNGELSIAIPEAREHNLYWLRHAAVLRPFLGSGVYETKLDTAISGHQQFGMVLTGGDDSLLGFMLYASGKIWGYVERIVTIDSVTYKRTFPGDANLGHDTGLTVPDPGPFHVRVTVLDDPEPSYRYYKFEWSKNGTSWTTAFEGALEGSGVGESVGTLANIGVFNGNHPAGYTAFDARFEYFKALPASAIPLSAPQGLADVAGDGEVTLTYESVRCADGYRIWRSETAGGPYTLAGTTSETSYTDSGLANGATYYYAVTAYDSRGDSERSAEVSSTPMGDPEVPGALPQAGLIYLLNAGDLVNLDEGEAVQRWPSAVGEAATAVTGSTPSFARVALGGQPSARFDGVSDHLTLPGGFQDFTSGFSVFVVAQPTELQSGFKLIALGNGPAQQNIGFGRNGATAGLQYFVDAPNGSVGWFNTANALSEGAAALFSAEQPGGAPGDSVAASVRRNGELVGSGNVWVPPVAARNTNYVGRSYWSEGRFEGDLAELIVYNRALASAERGAVYAYVAGKYGLDLDGATVPGVPANFSATAGNASIALAWDAVNGADGYTVYRATASGGPYAAIGTTSSASYADGGLTNGVQYYYVLSSYNGGGESAYSLEVSATPEPPTPPTGDIPEAGLIVHLNAESMLLADGQPVTLWGDQAGAPENATASLSHAPKYAEGAIWGRPVVRFDGVNDYLELGGAFEDFTGGLSVYLVARPAAVAAGAKFIVFGPEAQAIGLGRNWSGAGLQYFVLRNGGASWFNTADALSTGQATILGLVQDGGAPGDRVLARVLKDGLIVGQSADMFVPSVAGHTQNYIGRSLWGADQYFAGDIAEILLYDRDLSDTERQSLEAYLAARYGISLSPGLVSGAGAPAVVAEPSSRAGGRLRFDRAFDVPGEADGAAADTGCALSLDRRRSSSSGSAPGFLLVLLGLAGTRRFRRANRAR